jgi:hypothetical protein
MQEEFDAFISANNINTDRLLANRLGYTLLQDSFFRVLQDVKYQDSLMSLIKSDDDRATLQDVFACVNSQKVDGNSKSKEQIAITLTDRIQRVTKGSTPDKNNNAVKIAEDIASRAKDLQKRFPLLPYIEERNMRWGFNEQFAKTLSDYLNS